MWMLRATWWTVRAIIWMLRATWWTVRAICDKGTSYLRDIPHTVSPFATVTVTRVPEPPLVGASNPEPPFVGASNPEPPLVRLSATRSLRPTASWLRLADGLSLRMSACTPML
eukprot:1696359-Pyramimonas_sp.AAC.1